MNRFDRIASWAAVVLLAGAVFSRSAEATFIVDIDQVGPNVVATGSGTINLTGLAANGSGVTPPVLYASEAAVSLGTSAVDVQYGGAVGASNIGSGGQHFPDTATGDAVGIVGSSGEVKVPDLYVSLSPLSDTAVWDNATYASLGLTPGVYTYSWGPATAPTDTFVVDIGTDADVPEPSTLAVFVAGLLGLGLLRRRTRRGALYTRS